MDREAFFLDLTSLPKVSRVEVAAYNRIRSLDRLEPKLSGALSRVLASIVPELQYALSLKFCSLSKIAFENIPNKISPHSFHVFGTLGSQLVPFAIELDEQLAIKLVSLLLANNPGASVEGELFTPVEEGIFLYILALFGEELKTVFQKNVFARLNPLTKSGTLKDHLKTTAELLILDFELSIENSNFNLRVLSATSLLDYFSAANNSFEKYYLKGYERVAGVDISLRARIGEIQIPLKEFSNLEVGDIVLLEQARLRLEEDRLVGEIECLLGEDSSPYSLTSNLSISSSGTYLLQF